MYRQTINVSVVPLFSHLIFSTVLFTQLELSGHSSKEILEQYGGGLSFWQSVKMGGTGSRKVKYKSGLPELDALRDKYVDHPTVSFQWLAKSLLVRINLASRLYGLYLTHDEIETIRLYQSKEAVMSEDWFTYRLDITVRDFGTITFRVNYSDVRHLQKFFGRSAVSGRFQ